MAALVSLCAHAVSALMRFDLLISKVITTSRSVGRLLPFGDGPATLFSRSALFRFLSEDYTVFRKISLALVLMAMAGVASASASASASRTSDQCFHILWFTFCPETDHPSPAKAPEIDPASAMAGLTMLAGGLAVLRGRRRINPKD